MTEKISCCMIVRDDESTLETCLKSVRPHVDELVIVDTGSDDSTPEIARKYADVFEVWLGCNDAENRIEDFAAARNRSFSLASHDWVIWLDGDDELDNGGMLRTLAARATHDVVRYLIPYEYAYDQNGKVVTLQLRERFMRPRHRMDWKSPVHEGCIPVEPIEGTVADIPCHELKVCHRANRSTKNREPGRNLRILKKHIGKVGESDPRSLYYLGMEYGRAGDIGRSMHYLRRYVEVGQIPDEKCKALLAIAEHYLTLHDYEQAVEWGTKAMLQRSWPEPYFVISKAFYHMSFRLGEEHMGPLHEHNIRRSGRFAQMGLEIPQDIILFANPMDRFDIHRYLSVCLSRLGRNDDAIKSCEAGLSGLPGDEGLLANLGSYREKRSKDIILAQTDELLASGRLEQGGAIIIRAALEGQFKVELLDEPAVATAQVLPSPAQKPAPGKLDLVFYVGHGIEPWNPVTFDKGGMGGSETMVWQMARRLAQRGHGVRVYGHCTASMEGLFEGVLFQDASRFKNLSCDVMVASRRPEAVDSQHRVKSQARVLWVHDIHCGEELTLGRAARLDKILCLSEWHRSFMLQVYPTLNPDLVQVTRNGIDLTRFEGEEKRNPHRAVYSSSPDRGLLTALECWPKIRARVKDAELHVYYGFLNWETVAQAYAAAPDPKLQADGKGQLQNIAVLKHLIKTTPGVVMHHRVSQQELAREFMRSGVWAYPTWFSETSCISAMEVQAAGLHMVTSPIAALNETVGDRGVMIEGDWRSPEYAEAFVEATVEALNGLERGKVRTRGELQTYAREHFGLDTLADEWDAMLLKLHAERSENPVNKFHPVEVMA